MRRKCKRVGVEMVVGKTIEGTIEVEEEEVEEEEMEEEEVVEEEVDLETGDVRRVGIIVLHGKIHVKGVVRASLEAEGEGMMEEGATGLGREIGGVHVVTTALGGVIHVIDVVRRNKEMDHISIIDNNMGREDMGHAQIDTMMIDIEVVLLEGDDCCFYFLAV
jgi:hypothetical protein